jgi:hypothetical protein
MDEISDFLDHIYEYVFVTMDTEVKLSGHQYKIANHYITLIATPHETTNPASCDLCHPDKYWVEVFMKHINIPNEILTWAFTSNQYLPKEKAIAMAITMCDSKHESKARIKHVLERSKLAGASNRPLDSERCTAAIRGFMHYYVYGQKNWAAVTQLVCWDKPPHDGSCRERVTKAVYDLRDVLQFCHIDCMKCFGIKS